MNMFFTFRITDKDAQGVALSIKNSKGSLMYKEDAKGVTTRRLIKSKSQSFVFGFNSCVVVAFVYSVFLTPVNKKLKSSGIINMFSACSNNLYKSIFRAAMESRIIDHNPTIYLTTKGGGVPQEDRQAVTDEQAARLLDAIQMCIRDRPLSASSG